MVIRNVTVPAMRSMAAWDRAHRPGTCKLTPHSKLAARVAEWLQLQWSPLQLAGWPMRSYPYDATSQVLHRAI